MNPRPEPWRLHRRTFGIGLGALTLISLLFLALTQFLNGGTSSSFEPGDDPSAPSLNEARRGVRSKESPATSIEAPFTSRESNAAAPPTTERWIECTFLFDEPPFGSWTFSVVRGATLLGAEVTSDAVPITEWSRPLLMDVTGMFLGKVPPGSRIVLSSAQEASFELRDPATTATRTEGTRTIHELNVDFRGKRIILGRIIDDDGPVKGGDVSFYVFDGDDPKVLPVASATADAAGRFALPVTFEGDVLAVATRIGREPSWTRFHLPRAALYDVGTIELGRGAVVEGRVRSGRRALGRARLQVRDVSCKDAVVRNLVGGFVPAAWVNGRLVTASASTSTDEEGQFEISGLRGAEYDIDIVDASSDGIPIHASARRGTTTRVTAPALGIDIDVALCTLQFSVRDERGPVVGWRLAVVDPSTTEGLTVLTPAEESETAAIRVRGGREYELTLSHPYHDVWRGRVTPAVGADEREQEIVLTTSPLGNIAVRITNDPRNTIERLKLVAERGPRVANDAALAALLDDPSLRTVNRVANREADGRFLFKDLPLSDGRCRAVVAVAYMGDADGFWLPTTFESEIVPSQDALFDCDVGLDLGGQVSIRSPSSPIAMLYSNLALESTLGDVIAWSKTFKRPDFRGEEPDAPKVVLDSAKASSGEGTKFTYDLATGRKILEPNADESSVKLYDWGDVRILPPGEYTLRGSNGYGPEIEKSIVVEAGKVTRCDFPRL